MIEAIGSSLLSVGSFGLATAANYGWSGLVDWAVAAEFIAGSVGGGLIGLMVAKRLAGYRNVLSRIIAVLIFTVAGYVLYRSGTILLSRTPPP